jgi:hypothetical protein
VLLAGQSFDSAYEFALADFAARLTEAEDDPADLEYPKWMHDVQACEPQRVLFAHDLAEWRPPRFALGSSTPTPTTSDVAT